MISMISINRQQADAYKWFISSGTEVHHSRFGQDTLVDCLKSAGSIAPKANGMVEIVYRQIHMGTHRLDEVVGNAELLAKQIGERYSFLMVNNL